MFQVAYDVARDKGDWKDRKIFKRIWLENKLLTNEEAAKIAREHGGDLLFCTAKARIVDNNGKVTWES